MDRESDVDTSKSGPTSRARVLRDIVVLLLVAVIVLMGLRTYVVRALVVPSQSMQPTLLEGSRIYVNQLSPRLAAVHRGDIVVFRDPGGWLPEHPNSHLSDGSVLGNIWSSFTQFIGFQPRANDAQIVKRVIGIPGDTVSCCTDDGLLKVNGKAIDEPYLASAASARLPASTPFAVKVPAGKLWVLGDNRVHSQDSRSHVLASGQGFVPEKNVTGLVVATTSGGFRWLD